MIAPSNSTPIKRGRAERRGHNNPAALRTCELEVHRLVTTKLPIAWRSARGVYRFAPQDPRWRDTFRRPSLPKVHLATAAGLSCSCRRGFVRLSRSSSPGIELSARLAGRSLIGTARPPQWSPAPGTGTLRLGPLTGMLRRISDTPASHRSPPQHLTTLIKRPSLDGTGCANN